MGAGFIIASLGLLLGADAPGLEHPFKADYAFSLSTNFGVIPFNDVSLTWDSVHKELFAIGDGVVRVFNMAGMEIFTFGDDPEVGAISAVAPLEGGDLIVISYRNGERQLVRCTFRGEFIEQLKVRGVPPDFDGAIRGVMRYRDGRLYMADLGGMRIAVLDTTGQFITGFDVAELLEAKDKREALGLRGFNVDKDGNILFTIQPMFQAYVLTLAGKLSAFGVKGGAPGKFNVVAGIARDDAGYIYVSDILKSAVLVFDPNFVWLKEFGYRTRAASGLSAPDDMVAGGGLLFVVNHARRGVSVFRVGPGG